MGFHICIARYHESLIFRLKIKFKLMHKIIEFQNELKHNQIFLSINEMQTVPNIKSCLMRNVQLS